MDKQSSQVFFKKYLSLFIMLGFLSVISITSYAETKRSGFLNGGELGFTIGSQKIRQESTLMEQSLPAKQEKKTTVSKQVRSQPAILKTRSAVFNARMLYLF